MSVASGDVAIAGAAHDADAAGARSARPRGLRLREALLSTVAAGALSLARSAARRWREPAACTISGAVATCTGNQSAGIAGGVDFLVPPVTTLNVNNLTQAIAPASGTDGINFTSTGALTVTSNTGAFGITTAGNFAYWDFRQKYWRWRHNGEFDRQHLHRGQQRERDLCTLALALSR